VTERYLVAATTPGKDERARVLDEVLTFITSRQDARVLKRTGSPPTSCVITATPDAVAALRQAFGDRVVIERDSPLRLQDS
jgi:hypothetical protein